MTPDGPIVCFGEILIRLAAPHGEMLLQTPRLETCIGGAEANVAASLARLGGTSRMVSVLPRNALGRAAFDELRRHGVDLAQMRWASGRMGLYFLTPGAVTRPSEVIYDRAGSVFADAAPDLIDWDLALADASALHLSGVTPALGPRGAQAAQRAVESAVRLGIPVIFDGNFRGKLWAAWDGDAPTILRGLLATATLAFIDERDVALMLGTAFDQTDPDERRRAASRAAFEAFPRLERIAATRRVQAAQDRHILSATMFGRDGEAWRAGPLDLCDVVDRIGGGDAFAAGLIHARRQGRDDQAALDFALAATGLKHAVRGDFNPSSEADVDAVLQAEGLDVRR